MVQLKRPGFALLATVLSFIAEIVDAGFKLGDLERFLKKGEWGDYRLWYMGVNGRRIGCHDRDRHPSDHP